LRFLTHRAKKELRENQQHSQETMRFIGLTTSAIFGWILATSNPSADAQIMAVESISNPGGTYYTVPVDSTYGWLFSVGSTPVTVTELGYFDLGLNGLVDPHQVGIFDSGGNPVVQGTVPAGTAGILDGAYRFILVTPTTLAPNTTYVIGGHNPNQNDLVIAFEPPQIYADQITYLGAAYSPASGFSAPTTSYTANHGIFGPNFQLTAIPEPGEWTTASGVALLTVFGVRRLRAQQKSRS
jgi:hypothetical protein